MHNQIVFSITESFLRSVKNYPDKIAFNYIKDEWKTITYSDILKIVLATATYLLNIGLKKNDRVAILSENRHEWCSTYIAIIMAGGIAVPIDALLGPEEIKNILHDSSTSIMFHSAKTRENADASAARLAEITKEQITSVNFDSDEYKSVIQTEHRDAFPENEPEDIASIIYTSGTTGTPKGVMLTHKNFCTDAEAAINAGIVTSEDNVLSILPLHHTYAFMCTFLVPVFLGASVTYPASLKGPDIMSAMKDRGVSALIGVPQLLTLINNGIMNKINNLSRPISFILLKIHTFSGLLREKFDINIGRIIFKSAHKALGEKFRFFTSGGARLDPVVMKSLEAFGFTVLEGYGLTETSPMATFNPFSKRKPGSAGKPFDSVEIRIQNPSETGEGEIAIKGPMVMKGYYKNQLATDEVIRDNWFMTGDIGWIDNDGYLFITGRSKEVIVLSSGKNIYPEEVEQLYLSSPLIKEICVLGLEEQGMTESLKAVIVPDFEFAKQGKITNIQEEIKSVVNEISLKIPSYMRITGFSIRTEPLPRTPLGKLRRFMVKDLIAQPVGSEKKVILPEKDLFADETSKSVVDTVRQFSKKEQTINPDDNLELDIGLDSLSKIELVVALEKTFSLKLPEDFMADIQTVDDLIEKTRAQTTNEKSVETIARTGWRDILFREPSEDLKNITLEKPDSKMIPAFIIFVFLRILIKILFRLEVRGIENIPKDKNFIITPNHTSYLDGFAVILALHFSHFRKIYTLGLSKYFTGFLKSWFAKTAHIIPIDSSSYLNKALQMSAYVIRNRRSLAVFPEGGRSLDGNLMEFKKGVGILAIEMGLTAVPTLIQGSFEALPRGAKWPRFKKISVTFGRPLHASDIDFSKKSADIDEYQYFANTLREKVIDLKGF